MALCTRSGHVSASASTLAFITQLLSHTTSVVRAVDFTFSSCWRNHAGCGDICSDRLGMFWDALKAVLCASTSLEAVTLVVDADCADPTFKAAIRKALHGLPVAETRP